MTTTTDKLADALRALIEECESNGDFAHSAFGSEAGALSRANDALEAYDAERKAPPGAGFRVLWEIDSEAETPEAAAREAWDAMRRPDSTACVFDVRDEAGNVVTIDLAEIGA